MIGRIARLRCLARSYGWEDPTEKYTKNWWQYNESTLNFDETPEERGYQLSPHDQEINDKWKTIPRIYWQIDIDEHGINPTKILNAELRNNHFGDYNPQDETLPTSEIKTRVIHILRHFEKVDLRKIDWKANLLTGMKLDEFERVAFLTSVEHEFSTIFEDNVFDNLKTLEDVVGYLATDRYVV